MVFLKVELRSGVGFAGMENSLAEDQDRPSPPGKTDVRDLIYHRRKILG
jgi:hypothetical protein